MPDSILANKKADKKLKEMSIKQQSLSVSLAAYAQLGNENKKANENNMRKSAECLIVSLFFNSETGLLVYDSYARGEIYSKLISVQIPYHFFVTKV
jgi:hypothetical protein